MAKSWWWLLFTPSASLGVSPGVSPSLWGLGTLWGWRRRLLWPHSWCVISGCRCPKLFWGKGGVCLLLAFLCGRGKATSGSQQDTAAGHGQGGVSPVWEPSWGHPVLAAVAKSPSGSLWQPLSNPSLPLKGFVSTRSPFCGVVRAEGFGHPWP